MKFFFVFFFFSVISLESVAKLRRFCEGESIQEHLHFSGESQEKSMPALPTPDYTAPFWLPGGDAQTMGLRIACFIPSLPFILEQVELEDGDFILVDWLFASGKKDAPSKKLAVLSHGLEGDSTKSYMRAMALALARRGWNIAGRNFRGCGGLMNRLPRTYHSGDVDDLAAVISLGKSRGYVSFGLVRFSMGGNQVLKYLGERADTIPPSVIAGAAVSVPCDLTGCSRVLGKPRNKMYMEYFFRTLRGKMREKHGTYPALFPLEGLDAITTFKKFDDRYTAPIGGFENVEDYWKKKVVFTAFTANTSARISSEREKRSLFERIVLSGQRSGGKPKLFFAVAVNRRACGLPHQVGQNGGLAGRNSRGFSGRETVRKRAREGPFLDVVREIQKNVSGEPDNFIHDPEKSDKKCQKNGNDFVSECSTC
jgi:predicted alpha/beta-fold hydrolase